MKRLYALSVNPETVDPEGFEIAKAEGLEVKSAWVMRALDEPPVDADELYDIADALMFCYTSDPAAEIAERHQYAKCDVMLWY